jgi:hypothetical protein
MKINDAYTVMVSILAVVEQRHIGKAFWRSLHGHLG